MTDIPTSADLRTPCARYREQQKKRIVSEFSVIKETLKNDNPSNQSIIDLLAGRYNMSSMTVRRYLQADGKI